MATPYKEQVKVQLEVIAKAEAARKQAEQEAAKKQARYISFGDGAQAFLAQQEAKKAAEEAAEDLQKKQARHNARIDRVYRVVLFDRNNILPKREEFVTAKSKQAAIAGLQVIYRERARVDHAKMCEGQKLSTMVTLPSGVVSTVFAQSISADYYVELAGTSWGIADIMEADDNITATVSAEATVSKAEQKEQPTERRREWSAREKKAAARARALAKKKMSLVA